jgi:hypothetical protein
MQTNTLAKRDIAQWDFAPPLPRVVTFVQYGSRIQKTDKHWQSQPNKLMPVVLANLAFHKSQAEIAAAAATKATISLQKGLQHLLAEEKRINAMAAAQQQTGGDVVSRTAVIRGGALMVGITTAVCWLGTALSGTVLIHPLISSMLMIASVAFYGMSKLEK